MRSVHMMHTQLTGFHCVQWTFDEEGLEGGRIGIIGAAAALCGLSMIHTGWGLIKSANVRAIASPFMLPLHVSPIQSGGTETA